MTTLNRRTLLGGAVAAFGLAAVPKALSALSQRAAEPAPRRIDVHHHFAPPAWVTSVKGKPLLQPANTTWTPAKSIEDMDKGGVATAMVSITNPGLWFGDRAMTRTLARACNDYGARLVQDHPGRFGLFAAMPLPSVDDTLSEIAYAYDTLKADGVHLFTSYGDLWLGHPSFRPVMEELHRRKAVVHVHPTAANCCRNLDYGGVAPGILEYGTDTTRAILGVTFSGDAARYPDVRFIWSHGGGTVPFLTGRIEGAARSAADRLPKGFAAEAKRFFYDLAGAANPGVVASLLQLVSSSQVLFGTDFPPGGSSTSYVTSLAEMKGLLSAADLRAIDRENALRLIPRLGA
jgi:predicted TIM-barrel fold metal-dependent hydrolase